MSVSSRPHRLGANRVPIYYAGGEHIDRFRGERAVPQGPEDWVGSVSSFPPGMLPPDGPREAGISTLPDGASLRAAVLVDTLGWLGPDLAARWAGETGLLVKLLDAGERLPVHCHPSRPFAATHLHSPFGKTEGWIVMDDAPGGEVWLGFREDISRERLERWIEAQAVDDMLTAMNRLPARSGDVFYVPAGVPHSIGPGVMITELQEPTSFSVLAEYATFGLDANQATLGLGWATAVSAFDRSAYGPDRLHLLLPEAAVVLDDGGVRVQRLFA
ncbi:MAG: class I mannose-6-phosphate isomerase [Chloroflexi bacterium]|nr:class I mannose-6-phosphate isomerase [Chloroflexota bacterium]